jgi:hypothetical protein
LLVVVAEVTMLVKSSDYGKGQNKIDGVAVEHSMSDLFTSLHFCSICSAPSEEEDKSGNVCGQCCVISFTLCWVGVEEISDQNGCVSQYVWQK